MSIIGNNYQYSFFYRLIHLIYYSMDLRMILDISFLQMNSYWYANYVDNHVRVNVSFRNTWKPHIQTCGHTNVKPVDLGKFYWRFTPSPSLVLRGTFNLSISLVFPVVLYSKQIQNRKIAHVSPWKPYQLWV